MSSRVSILQIFNRYLVRGGEEDVVNRLEEALAGEYDLSTCLFDSADWKNGGRLAVLGQALKLFYNAESAAAVKRSIAATRPRLLLVHNLYPVGSPSIYRTALKENVPVLQYVHNFRPFSVSGTLWAKGHIFEESLRGNYLNEVRLGAWQGSVTKSALFATMLKYLHLSGWLRAVRGWIAISDFMRDRFIEAGVDPATIHTLRHSWTSKIGKSVVHEDHGYYLFLGRLVEEKGVKVLIETWEMLTNEMGENAPELIIAGTGDLEHLVARAAERNPRIRYVGFVEGAPKQNLLRNCRAMLAPSVWWEPLGLVTYEGYEYKKPMLAAASGGLSETVVQGVTGWLHDPGDAEMLFRDVVSCENLKDEERLAMGAAGRAWLDEHANPCQWRDGFNQIVAKSI